MISKSFLSKGRLSQIRGLLISVVIGTAFIACKGQAGTMQLASSQSDSRPNAATSSVVPQVSYADLVSRVAPAVVTVRSTERVRAAQQFPFFDDPFFRQFFGDRLPQQEPPQRVQGLGSGVIVNSDGYILTNYHVIDGAVDIKVELTDNRTFTAKVVGSDQPSDLAVLKRSEEHTSELQSLTNLVCRLL